MTQIIGNTGQGNPSVNARLGLVCPEWITVLTNGRPPDEAACDFLADSHLSGAE